jgi:hypothetical protein
MRMLIATLLVLAGACTGAAPSGSRTCTGALYDVCRDEHDCMSEKCFNFMSASFQVCSVMCTVGNDAPCMTNDRGQQATCMPISGSGTDGICTPPTENDCIPGL